MLLKMNDAELLAATKAARLEAHGAPLARLSMENKDGKPTGRMFITDHTSAWAVRSREWCELANEVDRRGLPQPSLV